MDFFNQKIYRDGLKAVVLDLAGTVVDHGSRASVQAFVELFRRRGVTITEAEARGPMGLAKKEHIRALAGLPAVREQWRAANGSDIGDADIDSLHDEYVPLQLEHLPAHCDPIPGATETVEALLKRGLKVSATTGYNREMMEAALKIAGDKGLKFDSALCASDVKEGRPQPWMIYRSMEAMGVAPPEAVINVGDTVADVESGVNAGVWSVGLAMTGAMLGLSREEVEALPDKEREARLREARKALHAAGAHYVIDQISDLPEVVERIDQIMAGEILPIQSRKRSARSA